MTHEGLLDGLSQYELPNGQVIFHRNRPETEFLFEEIFVKRSYIQNDIQLSPGDCVFDVGANIGLFTLFMAQRVRDLKVFAFEPMPAVFEALRANAALHDLNAELFQCGLGSSNGSLDFQYFPHATILSGYSDSGVHDTVMTFLRGQEKLSSDDDLEFILTERLYHETVSCPVRTLSSIIKEKAISRIDLLKIDVEKAELDVLEGVDAGDWHKIDRLLLRFMTSMVVCDVLRNSCEIMDSMSSLSKART